MLLTLKKKFLVVMTMSKMTIMMMMVMMVLMFDAVQSNHFMGGTISWKSAGGRKVRFDMRMGWRYMSGGPGCTETKIGKYVTGIAKSPAQHWKCQSGCSYQVDIFDVNYMCAGASKVQDWEQGQMGFYYTFPGDGPFSVGYSLAKWMALSNGKGNGPWNVATTLDLRPRSDTSIPNNSPQSTSKPIYYVEFGCARKIRVPVVDPDGDHVRCRWARGKECESVCNALPGAHLDEETCTLTFSTNTATGYIPNGVYAVALTIQDFPISNINVGTSVKTPYDSLSDIPLQFLVKTLSLNESCASGPRFVSPTPEDQEVIRVMEGQVVNVGLYADNGEEEDNSTTSKAVKIMASGPSRMTLSKVALDVNRTNTFFATLSWQTHHIYIGDHIVCVDVENDQGKSGNQKCFTITVVPKICQSLPCQNGGSCIISKKGGYSCRCLIGFTGVNCEIAPKMCRSMPCKNGGTCVIILGGYSCRCLPGFTGSDCQTAPVPVSTTPTSTPALTTTTVATSTSATSTSATSTSATSTSETSTKPTKPTTPKTSMTPKGNQTLPTGSHPPSTHGGYHSCSCVYAPSRDHDKPRSGPPDLLGDTRQIILFVVGLPLGLVLSLFTHHALSRYLSLTGKQWPTVRPFSELPRPKCLKNN